MKNIKDSDSDLIWEEYGAGPSRAVNPGLGSDGNGFSTDPEAEDYDKVTDLIEQLLAAVMDFEALSESDAIDRIKSRLDDRGDFHEHGY